MPPVLPKHTSHCARVTSLVPWYQVINSYSNKHHGQDARFIELNIHNIYEKSHRKRDHRSVNELTAGHVNKQGFQGEKDQLLLLNKPLSI